MGVLRAVLYFPVLNGPLACRGMFCFVEWALCVPLHFAGVTFGRRYISRPLDLGAVTFARRYNCPPLHFGAVTCGRR